MRYTIPDSGKRVNIPDNFIEINMANLGISRQEAIDMYLSDEGYLANETVAQLTEKAKGAGAGLKVSGAKQKRKPPVRKPDKTKEALISYFFDNMAATLVGATNINILNKERMIAFDYEGEKYELTLVKKRKPKKGD